jgi:hypothetical protein
VQTGRDEYACGSGLDARLSYLRTPGLLWPANEYSGAVARERLYYKSFARPLPACSSPLELSLPEDAMSDCTAAIDFAAYVAIDWADKQHDLCLYDAATGHTEKAKLKQTPEAISEWATKLRARYGGRNIAVCLEQSRGPLIYALLQYDFFVLFPVPPRTLAKY